MFSCFDVFSIENFVSIENGTKNKKRILVGAHIVICDIDTSANRILSGAFICKQDVL